MALGKEKVFHIRDGDMWMLWIFEKDVGSIVEKKYETWILRSWQHLNCSMKFMGEN